MEEETEEMCDSFRTSSQDSISTGEEKVEEKCMCIACSGVCTCVYVCVRIFWNRFYLEDVVSEDPRPPKAPVMISDPLRGSKSHSFIAQSFKMGQRHAAQF